MTVKELAIKLKDLVAEGKGEIPIYFSWDGKISFPVKLTDKDKLVILIMKANEPT